MTQTPHASLAQRSGLGFPIVAVSIAVFRGPLVLLASRAKPPFLGAFSLPGGVVEWGETLHGAALRELEEEVQVKARVIGFNRHIEIIDRDEDGEIKTHYILASFVGEWLCGEGTPGPEAAEIRWADPLAIELLYCTPNLGATVEAAAQIFKSNMQS